MPTGPAAGIALPACARQVLLWAHTALTALLALLFASTLSHLLCAAVHEGWGWKPICICLSPGNINLWGECCEVPEISSAPRVPFDGLKSTPWTPLMVLPIFPALLGCFSFTGGTPPPASPGQRGCGSLGTFHFSPFPSFPVCVSRLINLMSSLSHKNTNDLPLVSS